MSSSSEVDERTLREIYLSAFETAVKEEQPWTVMCSYNRLNGVYASENHWLLTEVLRDEWGFEGYVMSDWGAVSDRVAGVAAGLDLEMPASNGINDRKIVEAVRSGSLDEKIVDQAVERILKIVYRYTENAKPETAWDKEAQHLLAAEIAGDCMVLLKNEDSLLPLNADDEIAFIGEFAENPVSREAAALISTALRRPVPWRRQKDCILPMHRATTSRQTALTRRRSPRLSLPRRRQKWRSFSPDSLTSMNPKVMTALTCACPSARTA